MISKKDIKSSFVAEKTPLKDAIRKLDTAGEQILLIVDPSERLAGILTDGDIRRYILRNGSLEVPVSQIMNKKFTYLTEDKKEDAKNLIMNNRYNHIPLVDKNGKAVDLVSALDFVKKKEGASPNPVVIMAGGKGTRLWPITKIVPKPLIPLGDKTMIQIILDNFKAYGFRDFYVTVNYKKEMIKSYFAENFPGDKINFVEEEKYLGTVGGLGLLRGKFRDTIILSNCDIMAKVDYDLMLDWHKEHQADLTILGFRKKLDIPYGTIKVNKDNYVTELEEKPDYNILISTGIYLLEPSLLELIPRDVSYDMDKLIESAIKAKKNVTCYPIENGWYDIGQLEDFRTLFKQFEG